MVDENRHPVYSGKLERHMSQLCRDPWIVTDATETQCPDERDDGATAGDAHALDRQARLVQRVVETWPAFVSTVHAQEQEQGCGEWRCGGGHGPCDGNQTVSTADPVARSAGVPEGNKIDADYRGFLHGGGW
ncbi:MAG: hypothetical protein NVS2B16_22490 [Chloroflexota bacterium]